MEQEASLSNPSNNLRWVRAEDGIIGGVCLGLARQLEMDPWLVRAAWLMTFWIWGAGLLAYICCVIALPRTDRLEKSREKMILGVCLRLSQRGDLEVGLARLIALVLLVTSCGAAVLGYVLLHFVLPKTTGPESSRKSII